MTLTDEAHAVAEVAKTTGEIVKAAGGMGSYLARVVGSIPEDLSGLLVGDWLGHKRRRHVAVLEADTTRLLEGIAAERLSEPSPSILIPLLQAAVDESREELQALWAALLANAMVDDGKRVRRDYLEALRQMEPVDALVIDVISRNPNRGSSDLMAIQENIRFAEQEQVRLGIAANEWAIASGKLFQLGLLSNAHLGPPAATPFGMGFMEACKVG